MPPPSSSTSSAQAAHHFPSRLSTNHSPWPAAPTPMISVPAFISPASSGGTVRRRCARNQSACSTATTGARSTASSGVRDFLAQRRWRRGNMGLRTLQDRASSLRRAWRCRLATILGLGCRGGGKMRLRLGSVMISWTFPLAVAACCAVLTDVHRRGVKGLDYAGG